MPLEEHTNSNPRRDWIEDRRLVLHELERLTAGMDKLDEKLEAEIALLQTSISELRADVTQLKTKAAIWGTIAGAIMSAIVALTSAIIGRH